MDDRFHGLRVGFAIGQRRHYIGQDIADGRGVSGLVPTSGGFLMSLYGRYPVFKPFDTIDKADLKLVHDKFDGIKILPAGKASCKIMSGIDASVKTAAYGAGK